MMHINARAAAPRRKKVPEKTPAWTLIIITFVSAVWLTSCNSFPPPKRQLNQALLPESFSFYEPSTPQPDKWWKQFHSPELDELVTSAISGNLTLKQILARLEQSEMLARQARSGLFPTLNLTGDFSATRRHIDTGVDIPPWQNASKKVDALNTLIKNLSPIETQDPLQAAANSLRSAQSSLNALQTLTEAPPSAESTLITHTYRFGLASSYEADLWGRVRAQNRAASLDYAAAQEDTYAAMLTLSGQVVSQWLGVLALRQELNLVRRQLELNKTTLDLIELRFQKGRATALDVLQQRQAVAQTESLIPGLEANLKTAEQDLAVLLGRQPTTDLKIAQDGFPEAGPMPDVGLPAELLAKRPDVRARGLQLQAADWRVSAARADRLPSIRLTASASYGADTTELILNNWLATLAASLTNPIFDAGRRKAEVFRTQAVAKERLAAYEQTVLTAIKEVESALVQERKQREYLESLQRELEAARTAHAQAFERYRKGLNDYLPVISALTQLQSLERKQVQANLAYLNIRVRLALALGGTWMMDDLSMISQNESKKDNPGDNQRQSSSSETVKGND